MSNFKKDFGMKQRKSDVKALNTRSNDEILSERKETRKEKIISYSAVVATGMGILCMGLVR